MVAYVGPDTFVKGRGFRVSIVKEGESGHHPTGNWPCDYSKGHSLPWFWGPTLKDAEEQAIEYNRRMGIEPDEALKIVLGSIGLQMREAKPKRTPKGSKRKHT